MTMRVLVDATALPENRGGVGRYVDGLVAALPGDVVVVCQERDAETFRRLAPGATVVGIAPLWSRTPARLVWEQLRLPGIARRLGADVIHSPHYTMPLLSGLPVVVTFHDATFFSDPRVHTAVKRSFFRFWIRLSTRRAAGIVVPSAATASELARFVRPRRAATTVAPHGVDAAVFHPPTGEQLDAARELVGSPDWIAFLGTLEPRKNLPALIAAYASLSTGRDAIPPLVLAGGAGWETQLDAAIAAVPAPGRVEKVGFLPLELLAAFLGGSRLVVYPSLGEGFGLPVLEAMASGAAVLTTPRLALPEVGGDAVEYSEPDSDALRKALDGLLSDDRRREELRRRAVARAALFTWAASAAHHLDAYRAAARA